jgi:signal transduction histidine kinase
VAQEALTNVLRHAGPATAEVRVTYQPGAVVLEVIDDGRGPAATTTAGGHGQLGMRERVAMWGGTLDVGPRSDGGYRVAARLPYREEGAA